MAREQALDAQRALEAFDAEVPSVRARLAAQMSAARAALEALNGKTDAASRLQALELGRQADQLYAQALAVGRLGRRYASNGSLFPPLTRSRSRIQAAPGGEPSRPPRRRAATTRPRWKRLRRWRPRGSKCWYDAIQTLGGGPLWRQFVEGWVEARLRSPSTSPESVAMLARLREDSADERRRLDMASSDARAELLLSRLRLGAGLMRWSAAWPLGDSTRARVSALIWARPRWPCCTSPRA